MNTLKTVGLFALSAATAAATAGPAEDATAARAAAYHNDFSYVAKTFRGLTFKHGGEAAGAEVVTGLSQLKVASAVVDGPYSVKLEVDKKEDDDTAGYDMLVTVENLPTTGVTGCQPLSSFYTQVRDKLVATLPYAIEQMEENTGDQQELEGIRKDIEKAQKDVHAIEVFCGDLANMLRIRRNVYHAYTSAWGQIQLGDGTLSKRRLRASEVSHEQVIKRALRQMEHEPEVALQLLRARN